MTESERTRKTPDFNTELALSEIKGGLFKILLFVLAIYLLVHVLFRGGDPESIFRSWYRWILPVLCIVSMPLMYIVVFTKFVFEGLSVISSKRGWLKSAAHAKAIIIDKRIRQDYEYREDYSYQVGIPEVKLKYFPTLATNNSGEQAFWASISNRAYEKLEPGNNVDIYYSITDPAMFLIEGE